MLSIAVVSGVNIPAFMSECAQKGDFLSAQKLPRYV
jgi:hypothetical protein